MPHILLTGTSTQVVDQITTELINQTNTTFDKEYFGSPSFLFSLLAIAVAVVLWVLITKGKKKLIEATNKWYPNEPQRIAFVRISVIVARVLVIIGALSVILSLHGIKINIFILLLLLFIVIVFLAGQDAIKDCIAGILIFINRYFTIGDVIKYGDAEGKVLNMTILTTKIQDIITDDVITISNRKINEGRVVSHLTRIDIGLPYDLPASTAFQVLRDTCEEIKKIEGIENCVFRGTNNFAESAIQYQIGIYTLPEKRYALRRQTLMKVQECLAAAGVEIPLQQIDIHIK